MATPVVLKALLDLSSGVTFNETSADCYDISDIVITANTRRGRSRELDKIEAGYAVITVIDENGDFNPDNTASPYYGKLKPGNKIRLYPDYDDGNGSFRYPDIFTGYVFNYKINFSMGVNQANQITIEAYDAFKIFNSVSITDVTNSTTGDSSDERIGQILDLQQINWPAGLRTFETSALSLADDPGTLRTVLDAIRQVEDTEVGLVFVDGSGEVQFKNRTTANSQPDYNDAYKFSDNGIETSYNDLRLTQNDDILINRVTVKSFNNSTEVTVFDSTSETTYFTRSAERANVLLTSTTDLTGVANQLLANYKDSSLQIDRIVLNLSEYEQIDRVIAGLYFDIFFIPLYIEKTLSGNTTINRLGWIQGVNHDITPNSWLVTAFTGITNPYEVIPNWLTAMYGTGSVSFSAANEVKHLQTIAKDSQNNTFSLISNFSSSSSRRAIAKLAQNGEVSKIVRLPDSALTEQAALNIDNADKVIYLFQATANDNSYVVSLNNDLTLNWAKRWNDAFASVYHQSVIDSNNNIYILTGYDTTGYNAALVKYSSAGTSLIEGKVYDTSSNNEPILMDAYFASNHIYALYSFDTPNSYHSEIVKFNTSCEIVDQVAVAWDNNLSELEEFVVDQNNNKYFLAQTDYGSNFTDAQIIKINASNQIEWDKRYTDGTSSGYLYIVTAEFDSAGNLIVLFEKEQTSPTVSFIGLGVINTSGTVVESYKLSNGTNELESIGDLTIDTSGRLVIPTFYRYNSNDTASATVISLKPELETLGSYTFLTGSDFTFGTWSLTFTTSGAVTLTTEVLSYTSETYNSTTFTPTLTTVTSDVLTIEFD